MISTDTGVITQALFEFWMNPQSSKACSLQYVVSWVSSSFIDYLPSKS